MDTAIVEADTIHSKFDQADELGLCPKCGAVMNELDRLQEGLYAFIWLECSKSGCDGQWLQRKSTSNFSGV
jgi:hypothetical protein